LTFAADRLVKPEIREWPLQPKQLRPDLVRLQAHRPFRKQRRQWLGPFAFRRTPHSPRRWTARIAGASGDAAHPPAARPTMACRFGGWLCAFAYELGGLFEPSVGLAGDANFPLAWLTRIPAAILFDRHNGRCVLVAESGRHALIDSMARDLAQALPPVSPLPARRPGRTILPPFWQGSRASRTTSVPAMCSRSICRAAGRQSSAPRLHLHRCLRG
jgi:anthranilate synthase component 1